MRQGRFPRLRAYAGAVVAGAAVGALVLGVVVAVAAWRDGGNVTGGPGGPLELQGVPVRDEAVPLGRFGACVQERLEEVAPAGDETESEMLDAQQSCIDLLDE